MSLDATLLVARSGLALTQRQLANAAANVANAGTEGYTRKSVTGRDEAWSGPAPAGVRSTEARRDVDAALSAEIGAARSALAAAGARERILTAVERAHGDPEAGDSLSDLTQRLSAAFTALRESPSESPRQAQVVAAAEGLAGRVNGISAAIREARQAAQDGMVGDVAALNAALREVAALNAAIRPLAVGGRSTAALEDRRDAAIARIAAVVEVRVVPAESGTVSLIARGGTLLPLDAGRDAFSIEAVPVSPGASHAGGTLPGVMMGGIDLTGRLLGGSLDAHTALRDQALPLQQAELDIAAAATASRFEAQGLRLFGSAGTVPAPGAVPAGYASAFAVNPAVRSGPAAVRDGTHAVAGAAGGPTAFTPNAAGGPAGFTTLIDRVLERSLGAEVREGVAQPGFPATALGPDGDLVSRLGAARTLGDYAALLVAGHTADRAAASGAAAGAKEVLDGLSARFDERSGVDVDAEMAAMVTLQNAYAANARVMGAVQSMYDALFQAVR